MVQLSAAKKDAPTVQLWAVSMETPMVDQRVALTVFRKAAQMAVRRAPHLAVSRVHSRVAQMVVKTAAMAVTTADLMVYGKVGSMVASKAHTKAENLAA